MIPHTQIIERKTKADGSVHEYVCDVVFESNDLLVIVYVMKRGGILPGVALRVEPGGISYGYFWRDRPYNLYRMKQPDGSIIAHRIDAVADVHWAGGSLDYRDLALDWWLLPGVEPVMEDEDELDAAVLAGQLTPEDVAAASAARELVERDWRGIIASAEAFERDNFETLAANLARTNDAPRSAS